MAARSARLCVLVLILLASAALQAQEVLKARVRVDLEAVWAAQSGLPYPLDNESAARQALEESAYLYGVMIHGWAVEYTPANTARNIAESFTAQRLGTIAFGDGRLSVHDVEREGALVWVWSEYHADAAQSRRLQAWRKPPAKKAQAIGRAPIFSASDAATQWGASVPVLREAARTQKAAAVEDAARAALLSLLRGSEANRPRRVRSEIA